jgi:hypothetical protein
VEEEGETEHRSGGWREDGEVEEDEGETELRRSRFTLFKRTLVGASSAAGTAAAETTTAKATTKGDPIGTPIGCTGGREGGAPFPTRCGEDAGTEREGARERLGGGGGEIYSMGGRGRRKREGGNAPGVASALRVSYINQRSLSWFQINKEDKGEKLLGET